MSIIYNGYAPGESRTRTMRPRKADKGHSVVGSEIIRKGDQFAFAYRLTCQCGKTFSSQRTGERCWQAHRAHLKREGVS
jgi:hypothetical protein